MALCDTPSVICNQFNLQGNQVQQYLMIHLLVELINAAGGSAPTDDADLQEASAGYLCQGSPGLLNAEMATAINAAELTGVDLTTVNCWSPLQLSAAQAYLTCLALDAI